MLVVYLPQTMKEHQKNQQPMQPLKSHGTAQHLQMDLLHEFDYLCLQEL